MKILILFCIFINVHCGLIRADDWEIFPASFDLANLDGKNGFFLNAPSSLGCNIVREIGDVNGDGIDDILVGADEKSLVYVVFGTKGQWPIAINGSNVNGSDGFIIDFTYNGYSIPSISGVGDFNGDGIDDISIGSSLNNITDVSCVIFGRKSEWPAVIKTTDLNGENGVTFLGNFSGHSISGVRDVNKDGFDDILIGALNRSYLVFGNKGPWPAIINLFNMSASNGIVILYPKDSFASLGGGGDFNGDGIADILIGVYGQGLNYVLFGKKELWPETIQLTDLNGKNGFTITNQINTYNMYVSRAGDINGDGIEDILIGYAQLVNFSLEQSYVIEQSVIFGSKDPWFPVINVSDLNGVNGFVINGTSKNLQDSTGSNAGDFNGDGIDDILIAAPRANNEAGQSYILLGRKGSWPAVFKLASLNGSNGFAIDGIHPNDHSGCSVNGAGDVNGDGFDDIFIGSFIGQSYVMFGYSDKIPDFPDNTPLILELVFGIGGGIVLTVFCGYYGYQYYQHRGYAVIEPSSDIMIETSKSDMTNDGENVGLVGLSIAK